MPGIPACGSCSLLTETVSTFSRERTGAPFVYPGRSLVEELELLTRYVGLTPAQALASATVEPARWFGRDNVVGTVETGKLADIVLLGSDPSLRSSNLRDVLGVMIRGRYYSRSELG